MTEHILLGDTFRAEVAAAVQGSQKSVVVISAYVKCSAIQWLAEQVPNSRINVAIVAGWSMGSLAQGASDLEAYLIAKKQGWKFGIMPGLHAKLYVVDSDTVFVGSANLTSRGLNLGRIANIEAGARITPTNVDIDKLARMVDQSLWLNNNLYADIEEKLRQMNPKDLPENDNEGWPESVDAKLKEMPRYLWVDDMFMTDPGQKYQNSEAAALSLHDQTLLGGLSPDSPKAELEKALRKTNVVRWLKHFLTTQAGHWARFGTISAALHDALMDDPKPYRRDIKTLQSNLFAWLKYSEMSEFEFRQHRRTTTIHLL